MQESVMELQQQQPVAYNSLHENVHKSSGEALGRAESREAAVYAFASQLYYHW